MLFNHQVTNLLLRMLINMSHEDIFGFSTYHCWNFNRLANFELENTIESTEIKKTKVKQLEK